MSSELQFGTRAIHDGQNPLMWNHQAVIPPISLSTTFQHQAPNQFMGFNYSRSGNPTRKCLEECIASLECANHALCFASGMSATLNITHLLKVHDHVMCCDDLYGGTNVYFRTCASKMGIDVSFVDMRDIANIQNNIRKNTKMVWMETPNNPNLKLIDIKGVTTLLKDFPDIISVVDNTFMTPYFQKPLTLGVDIVMHSLTKYMNGHSDVLMGTVATNNVDLYERLKYLQNSLGAVPSAFDCFLVNRGLKTLHVRMERHMQNGLAVAKFLEEHKTVEKVNYPGLKSHPQYELAKRQCSGFSGMMSFYIKGGLAEALKFVKNLKVFISAGSLGSNESLVSIPSLLSHKNISIDERKKSGITDNLIRLSVGIESIEDLLKDLDQALEKSQCMD